MDNSHNCCTGKSGSSKSSGLTRRRDRLAQARYAQGYRDRKKVGHVLLKVECDEGKAQTVAELWNRPSALVAVLLVELAAMKAIEPDPNGTRYYTQSDGACWCVWPDGELFRFSPVEWSKWKSSGFMDPIGGWRHSLGFTEMRCTVLTANQRAERRQLLGFGAAQ